MRAMALPVTLALSSLLSTFALSSCGRDGAPSGTGSQTPVGPASAEQAAPLASDAAARKQTRVVFVDADAQPSVTVEVVQTPAKIQRGLMHRQHLAPDRGMLFVFASDRVRSFWMKNTLIPLDMLFVTADGVVAGIIRDTEPLSLESRTVGIPTRYVLEVNGGWTATHGIEVGARLRFDDLPVIENPPL